MKHPLRQEQEKTNSLRDVLIATERKDPRTGEWYMRYIESDEHLERMIGDNRCPSIFMFSDNNCHIVFLPPHELVKSSKDQKIAYLPLANNGEDMYVIHDILEAKHGPRCICSYAVVSKDVATWIYDRILKILDKKDPDKATKFAREQKI